jgi:hypothetical protein
MWRIIRAAARWDVGINEGSAAVVIFPAGLFDTYWKKLYPQAFYEIPGIT